MNKNFIRTFLIGALTSKPYAFTARSWELISTETVDFFDTFLNDVRVDTRGSEIMRILPKINNTLNEEWISDKIRFSYDGLKRQRFYFPLIRKDETQNLEVCSWEVAFNKVNNLYRKKFDFFFILGDFINLETQMLLKILSNRLGAKVYNQNNSITNVDFRANYLVDLTKVDSADFLLLLGLDVRLEFPVLNIKVRRKTLEGVEVCSFGYNVSYNYTVLNIGAKIKDLKLLIEGKHLICKKLVFAKNPVILIGSSFQNKIDSFDFFWVISYLKNIVKDTYFMQNNLTVLNANELGFHFSVNFLKKQSNVIYYVLNADNIKFLSKSNDSYVIYQGHNGDRAVDYADIILPGSAPTEQNGLFLNLIGDKKLSKFVLPPPGNSRVDWKILKGLSDLFGFNFSINSVHDLHKFMEKHLTFKNDKYFVNKFNIYSVRLNSAFNNSMIENFYLTDSISRSSLIMALSSKRFNKNINFNI